MSKDTYNFKVALIGDSGVGKSAIMNQYADQTFDPSHLSTIGIDLKVRHLDQANDNIKLTIWDTAGQEKYDCITCNYLRQSNIGILVFALDSYESFINVERWHQKMIKEHSDDNVIYVLCGNKSDNKDMKYPCIPQEDIDQLIGRLQTSTNQKINYLEVSAKNNTNIFELFDKTTRDYITYIKEKSKIKIKKEEPITNEQIVTPHKCCVIL